MKQTLDQYVKGELDFTPIMNCIQYDKLVLNRVGRLVYDQFKNEHLPEPVIKYKTLIGIKRSSTFFTKRDYSFIAILFYTAMLDPKTLAVMFGLPFYHSEFGEGLRGVEGVPKQHRRKGYASYFVTINNTLIHIGYDHRGTTIEVPPTMTPTGAEKILTTLVEKLFNHESHQENTTITS